MPISPKLFHYFRACLVADQHSLSYTNIYHKRISHRLYLPGKEMLLSGELPYYPLEQEYAEAIAKELALYSREKQFAYCSWFLVGHTPEETVCAPLIIQQLCLEEKDEGATALPLADHISFNLPALQLVAEPTQDEVNQLQTQWPSVFHETNIIKAARLLETIFPALDTSGVYTLPALAGEKEVKQAIRKAKTNVGVWKIVPASVIALMDIPLGNQAIEADLTALANTNQFSAPLKALFSVEPHSQLGEAAESFHTELLSDAQEKAIDNAKRYSLSQITGPPGTGKSFTIANLAIDQLARGESTLIVAKTDTAANVIHQLIEDLLPEVDVCIRAGKGHKRKLQHTFRILLAGIAGYERSLKQLAPAKTREYFRNDQKKIAYLEDVLARNLAFHEKWGKAIANRNTSFGQKIKAWYYRMVQPSSAPWQKALELERLSGSQKIQAKRLLQGIFLSRLTQQLQTNRKAFKNFSASLRVKASGEQLAHWENTDFTVALKALPIWVVTLKELGTVLPMKKELFDLLIIEEATQCDIASSLPAFQRAKRAVIVGDPQQLRHLSFLSYQKQAQLQTKWEVGQLTTDELNYRDNSILDLGIQALQSQDQLVLLDEHFRSQPEIIAFSNRHFYQDSLQIMTQLPDRKQQSLRGIAVNGQLSKKINQSEANAILSWLKDWLSQEQKDAVLSHSIGILSPFREQVNYLSRQIQENIPLEAIQRHNIKIDTPYGFQGEERDTMLISMTLDKESHPTAWRHLARPEVWNVSITRARHQQILFHSVAESDISQPLIREYVSSLHKSHSVENTLNTIDDVFMKEVCDWLTTQKHLCFWPDFALAGQRIDLLVKNGEQYKGIDLIGYPGRFSESVTFSRYEQLSRIGIKVFPLPYSLWQRNKMHCQRHLLSFLR